MYDEKKPDGPNSIDWEGQLARLDAVAQEWEMICPRCGRAHRLDITARVDVRLVTDGTDTDEAQSGNHEWDDMSAVNCQNCGHATVVASCQEAFSRWVKGIKAKRQSYPVCSMCHSHDILSDAHASWDPVAQEWVLHTSYDRADCNNAADGCDNRGFHPDWVEGFPPVGDDPFEEDEEHDA